MHIGKDLAKELAVVVCDWQCTRQVRNVFQVEADHLQNICVYEQIYWLLRFTNHQTIHVPVYESICPFIYMSI